MNNSDEIHVHVKTFIYKQQGGDLIKYIFMSRPLKKEKGESADFEVGLQWGGSFPNQSDKVVQRSNRCKQHCPCICQHMAFSSFLKETMGGRSQEIKASDLIGILLRHLFPSDLEVKSRGWLALYCMLVLSVIMSVPEAEQT